LRPILPETVPIQPIERLHAGEVVTIAVSACVVAAALTFILLDLYYWRYHFDHRLGGHEDAGGAIDTNFGNDKRKRLISCKTSTAPGCTWLCARPNCELQGFRS